MGLNDSFVMLKLKKSWVIDINPCAFSHNCRAIFSVVHCELSNIIILVTMPSTIHLRFPNREKRFSMDAKHAWFFPAARAGDAPESIYKTTERETAAGYLSKGRVFDAPMRRCCSGVWNCASGKPDKDAEGAVALSFS